MADNDTDLMKKDEVMAKLRISRRTLYRYQATGVLVPVKINIRTLRWKKADVERMARGEAVASAG